MSDQPGRPSSGSRLPFAVGHWWGGTYLLHQRGIEYFRPGEEPAWLDGEIVRCTRRVGGLPTYHDETTGEFVPVLFVKIDHLP